MHQYTITHAIEDRNVLRFHIDYFKPEGKNPPKPGEGIAKSKVIETILSKHDSATNGRKFNAILATASINDAIEYFELFNSIQTKNAEQNTEFRPLNVACVFPHLLKETKMFSRYRKICLRKEDNQQDPEGKKVALTRIIADYNTRFKTNHRISEFDSYYQDVQKRIKDQQYPNTDLSAAQKLTSPS